MKRTCLLVVAVSLALPSMLSAATKNWSGAVNGNFSNGGNWTQGTPPVAGDDLVFGPGSPNNPLNNDLAPGTMLHSLTFLTSTHVNGNTLGLTGGMSTSGPGTTASFLLPFSLGASQTWFGQFGIGVFSPIDLGPYTLTLSGGPLMGVQSSISGTGGLVVDGNVNLWAANTFTGPTVVKSNSELGCVCVLPGPVNVAGRIAMTRSIIGPAVPRTGALTSTGGVIAVFDGATESGNLTLDSASQFVVTANSAAHAPLSVTGSVALGNAQLKFTANFTPALGTVFTLIDNDGSDPVSGTFAGLPEGARLGTAQISYHGGSGNDVTLTIVPPAVPTSTGLQVRPNPTYVGAKTTLNATVTSTGGTPTGSVTFYDGASALVTAPLTGGSATALVGPLPRGLTQITATYVPDNSAFLGSTSQAVQLSVEVPAAATTTVLSVTPLQSVRGQAVTLTAAVTSVGGSPFGSVVFTDGADVLDSRPLTGPTVSITTTELSAGEHTLRAVFVPMGSFLPSTSDAVMLTVVESRRRAARH